jgi:hypothetical protein
MVFLPRVSGSIPNNTCNIEKHLLVSMVQYIPIYFFSLIQSVCHSRIRTLNVKVHYPVSWPIHTPRPFCSIVVGRSFAGTSQFEILKVTSVPLRGPNQWRNSYKYLVESSCFLYWICSSGIFLFGRWSEHALVCVELPRLCGFFLKVCLHDTRL